MFLQQVHRLRDDFVVALELVAQQGNGALEAALGAEFLRSKAAGPFSTNCFCQR
jgi:hypothetical protein